MAEDNGNEHGGMAGASLSLREDFEPHSYEQWKKAAEALLKGKPFDKLLISKSHEGFDIQPLYMKESLAELPHMGDFPGLGSRVRGGQASGYLRDSWMISQEYTSPAPEDLRNWIVRELCLGVTESNICCDAPTRSGTDPDKASEKAAIGFCGVSLANRKDLEKAFDGVYLEMAPVYFQSGMSGVPILAGMVSLMSERELGLEYLKGCVEIDPLAFVNEHGQLPTSLSGAYDEMAAATHYAVEKLPNMQTVHVGTHAYHKAGCTSSQEMGFALATAVDYIRALQQRGVEAVDALQKVRLSLAVGPQFFIEIAKFRALRMLWAKVAEAFGAAPEHRDVFIHARTGQFNKTRLDAHTNMLRTTTEAFSAVVGGVDGLHVSWFDEMTREPDEFSRRTARNVQNVLKEECDLDKVVDVAGGSWAVENLTHEMAEKAWGVFQEMERAGGMAKALESGLPQKLCAESFAKKQKMFRQRRDVLVGVNTYPNTTEKPLPAREIDYDAIAASRAKKTEQSRHSVEMDKVVLKPEASTVAHVRAALENGATFGDVLAKLREGQERYGFEAPEQRRLAEDYEDLRSASREAALNGKAPLVFQANIGPSRRYRARADWTSAFFHAAGFEVLNQDDFEGAETAANKLRETGAHIAVITADDETYAAHAEEVARGLKAASPNCFVILAGALDEAMTAKVKEAGVDDFVHLKVNNYEFNKMLLEKLGVL